MFLFDKNLQTKHKVILCLVLLGITANYLECTNIPGKFVEFLPNGGIEYNITKIVLGFGIFVKMLVVAFFRKF